MKRIIFFLTLITLISSPNCKAQEFNPVRLAKDSSWYANKERKEREIFNRLNIDRSFRFYYDIDSTGKKFTAVSVDYYDSDKCLIKTVSYSNPCQIHSPDSIFTQVFEFNLDSTKSWKEYTMYILENGVKKDIIRHQYEYDQNSYLSKFNNQYFSYSFNDKGLVSEDIVRENNKVTASSFYQYDYKNREIKRSNYSYENGEKRLKDETITLYDDINRKMEQTITLYVGEPLKYQLDLQFDNENRIIESSSIDPVNVTKSVSNYDENGLVRESLKYKNGNLSSINEYKYLKAGEDYSFDFYGVKIK